MERIRKIEDGAYRYKSCYISRNKKSEGYGKYYIIYPNMCTDSAQTLKEVKELIDKMEEEWL